MFIFILFFAMLGIIYLFFIETNRKAIVFIKTATRNSPAFLGIIRLKNYVKPVTNVSSKRFDICFMNP
jgi:hypothetical protein